MVEDLILTANERAISGWETIAVTRGIERCPSEFGIRMTERYPGEINDVVVQPGDDCTVKLGNDLVLTGYIDKYGPAIEAQGHSIEISGRSKCADLVDCAAEWPGGQISGSTVLGVAQKLARPYGINVVGGAEIGPPIPQFNLTFGETPFEIIERIARYRTLLAYDTPDGNLTLAAVGTTKAASGFTQGQNIQSAYITYSQDQRFSEYQALLQSTDTLGDAGASANVLATVSDAGVKRHRRHVLIAEAVDGGIDVVKRRAQWDCNRRIARSSSLQLVTDSWRDAAGILWTPNTLVAIDIPILKISKVVWLISEVTYLRNEQGTTASLVILPPNAFVPEPIQLQPALADVPAGLATGGK